jgi:hypothetical protein
MSGIQPQALTKQEFIRLCETEWDHQVGLPPSFQLELLNRYARSIGAIYPPPCDKQLELFE